MTLHEIVAIVLTVAGSFGAGAVYGGVWAAGQYHALLERRRERERQERAGG